MAAIAGWRRDLIRSQIARSIAFERYLADLRAHEFSSKLPQQLIPFFSSINKGITAKLQVLLRDPDFAALPDEAAESHLVRYSDLYRYLYRVTSILEYVETSRTILEFGVPLQRVVTAHKSSALVLLHALPEVNYSWEDLVGRLVQIATQLEINIDANPPAHAVWAIGFPGPTASDSRAYVAIS
jgi:hypothetical protein